MNKDYASDALRYLLNELDADERASFEDQMASDPAMADLLKCAADTLARFAREAAPAEVMDPMTQHLTLTRILAATADMPRTRPDVAPKRWRWGWPLAACLLLLLNLWQLLYPVIAPTMQQGRWNENDRGRVVTPVGEIAAGAGGEDPRGIAGAALPGATDRVSVVAEELRRLRAVRVKYDHLGKAYARLQAEHDVLVEQLVQFAQTGRGVTRLSMMELADAESYAAGRRKGLLDLALSVLTEPGLIALEPDGSISDGSGNGNPSTDPTDPGFDPGTTNTVPDTNEPTNGGDADPDAPYAWSVYDEAQSRGFLNLYNLPEPAANESLQLWVRLDDGEDYVRVGEVPEQYYGGSGSIAYALPGVVHSPSEILITSEPSGSVPTQPGGTTVLRGP